MSVADARPTAVRTSARDLRVGIPGPGAADVPRARVLRSGPARVRTRPAGREALVAAVRPVLAGLSFPAQRWQVLAEADAWGAPGVLRRVLADLPVGEYADLTAVLGAVRARHRSR
ncbi:hypothetical protein [Pseudonocardia alni]|uniref:DUF2795 domain-containing protein n=1 Tax=Pseudonocardia alni TaxID=33907 RepID=UPI00332BDDB4